MHHTEFAQLLESHDLSPSSLLLEAAPEAAVRWLPEWVARHCLATQQGVYWLWVSSGGASPVRPAEGQLRHEGPDQLVLDLPDGRYTVEIYDTATRAWISRESAAASPLVAGLPLRDAPLIVRIQPFTGVS